MPRFGDQPDIQRALIARLTDAGATIEGLASACACHPRTVRDWRRGKYRIPREAMEQMYQVVGLPAPSAITWLPDFWHVKRAGSLGGHARMARHGPLGTPESRRQGWLSAVKSGRFSTEKLIRIPSRSTALSELIGILLGDGQITSHQVCVHGNALHEWPYLTFVQGLFRDLFGLESTLRQRRGQNALTLLVSSRPLVEYLRDQGIPVGNKISHGARIPARFISDRAFQAACLRGLMDTDGSFYSYRHVCYSTRYLHAGLCFTSHARGLLEGVHDLFLSLGFRPRSDRKWHVTLNRGAEIARYMDEVGSHNPHVLERFVAYQTAKVATAPERLLIKRRDG